LLTSASDNLADYKILG